MEDLKTRIEKLSEEEFNLVCILINQYFALKEAPVEMKQGYGLALNMVLAFLNISSIPDIDMRPGAEQRIDKIVIAINEIEKKYNSLKK